jgi:hypothetical protein
MDAKARAQNAIERGRGTTALEMAKYAGPSLRASAARDLFGDHLADSTAPDFVLLGGPAVELPGVRSRTFGHYHQSTEATFHFAPSHGASVLSLKSVM